MRRRRTRAEKEAGRACSAARSTPIIQPQSIAGRSLVAVIAIMSFLAALTLGGVVLVRTSANDWQSEVSRELTVQVRPPMGAISRPMLRRRRSCCARRAGVAQVRAYTREESAQLLEPWLGTGLATDRTAGAAHDRRQRGAGCDARSRGSARAARPRGADASLDDHRAFIERMRT